MPLVINSPYSGQPVKIRDQDIGRAIRDEEGRIFYAVPRSEGEGFYASLTRKGSAKDEERYDKQIWKSQQAREVGKIMSDKQVHDATGKSKKPGIMVRLIVMLIVLSACAGGAYFGYHTVTGEDPLGLLTDSAQTTDDEQSTSP